MPHSLRAIDRPEKNAVELFFKEQDPMQPIEPGELYYVRGAMVWPEGTAKRGYTLIGGQSLDNKVVWIFEEQSFIAVRDIKAPAGDNKRYAESGLLDFFQTAWERYKCRKFFIPNVEKERLRLYRQEIMREMLIDPKPLFISVPYSDDPETVDNLVLDYARHKSLRIEKGSDLFNRLQDLNDGRNYKLLVQNPSVQAVTALRVLIAGFEYAPWKMPEEKQSPEIEAYW